MSVDGQGTKWCRNITENFNRLSTACAGSKYRVAEIKKLASCHRFSKEKSCDPGLTEIREHAEQSRWYSNWLKDIASVHVHVSIHVLGGLSSSCQLCYGASWLLRQHTGIQRWRPKWVAPEPTNGWDTVASLGLVTPRGGKLMVSPYFSWQNWRPFLVIISRKW